jgi:hypothetical protein
LELPEGLDLKIYVCSKFEEKPRCRAMQELLRNAGHEITLDWTQFEDPPGWDGDVATATPAQAEFLCGCAQKDWAGVLNADLVVVLTHPNLRGGLIEMGIAIANGIPVIAVGPHYRTVFFLLPDVALVRTDADVLPFIQTLLEAAAKRRSTT